MNANGKMKNMGRNLLRHREVTPMRLNLPSGMVGDADRHLCKRGLSEEQPNAMNVIALGATGRVARLSFGDLVVKSAAAAATIHARRIQMDGHDRPRSLGLPRLSHRMLFANAERGDCYTEAKLVKGKA
jgi:hypothetical protein